MQQKYSVPSLGGGVGNSSVGGGSARDAVRVDSSFSTSNFSLNSRLGPPDFYPQTPNCHEETLTREYLQTGYKETVEGIEEARESQLTLVGNFTKSEVVFKCKEALRKRLRAINESRAQKRKAGQVYGVPLSEPLLVKAGTFPEQRACGEEFRRKWIEGLSQQHRRLHTLADNVPHGYRKKSLFEILIRYNVPLLRATWFIKITYLNQIRPTSTNVSPGSLDKSQYARSDLWTRDVIEYLQQLLDEILPKDGSYTTTSNREPLLLHGATQRKVDPTSINDVEEPSLQSKWSYIVHLLNWHHGEGLLVPSLLSDWALGQIQEKDSVDALELLLPIMYMFIEGFSLSQTYVRLFVDISMRHISALSAGSFGNADNLRKRSLTYVIVEMLRYLILVVADTFVSLDCFALPIFPDVLHRDNALKMLEGTENIHSEVKGGCHRHLSFGYIASSLRKRAANLANIVDPSFHGHGVAKIVQALDNALVDGDTSFAYCSLFEDFSDLAMEEEWIAEVSPCLRPSLNWISTVSRSLICSIFLLCEWATCDYRDCRSALPENVKMTGRKNFCQLYIAALLLQLKREHMRGGNDASYFTNTIGKSLTYQENFSGGTTVENAYGCRNNLKSGNRRKGVDLFESPSPLHDIIVCWIDQHEVGKGEGFERLHALIVELIRNGIFYPQAYVRQLISSGIMDGSESSSSKNRQMRHHRILKELPGSCLFDILEEARIADDALLVEVVKVYSNERRLLLHGHHYYHSAFAKYQKDSSKFVQQGAERRLFASRDGDSYVSLDCHRSSKTSLDPLPNKLTRRKLHFDVLKGEILSLLEIPNDCLMHNEAQSDDSQESTKRVICLLGSKPDVMDSTPGIEEGRKSKRQKLNDERSFAVHGVSARRTDDDDNWWIRKGPEVQESLKIEPSLKSMKPTSRGRRKTQSLAQLAAARIESSQGASTSHLCDNKVSCPHHEYSVRGEIPKEVDRLKTTSQSDITKTIKRLRSLEKCSLSIWLSRLVKRLIEVNEKAAPKHPSGTFANPVEGKNYVQWRFGEDELSAVLYLLDICSDLLSAARFLIWLFPRIHVGPSSTGHAGRKMMMLFNHKENHYCGVGEAFMLSSLQRFENVLVAADLVSEVLTAAMNRAVTLMALNARSSCSMVFAYVRSLLKKYRDTSSVSRWEQNFRSTCDERLIAELDARAVDGDSGFSPGAGAVEDYDEYIRQTIGSRMPRTGPAMKDRVQRHVEAALRLFYSKEQKQVTPNITRTSLEKCNDGYQVSQEIVSDLLDCIRQNSGGSQEVDSSLVASAVSAIVANIGPAVVKLGDCSPINAFSSPVGSLSCAHYILRIHIMSLRFLKEALGDRVSRIFEIAMAAEASSTISGVFASMRAPRSQFQLSSEAQDIGSNNSKDLLNNSMKALVGRATRAAAAVSALIVGVIVHGVVSLERMVTVFKIKEGLDLIQFIRSSRSTSNGMSRSFGTFKLDCSIEVYLHWFRLLIGNSRTIFDGLVIDILGESYVLALSRMQHLLPLSLILPPAYSIFGMAVWRPYIAASNSREDIQLYHNLSLAIRDATKHRPFRDICLRNTKVLYESLSSDVGDSEFAAMLELHSLDKHAKTMAFAPLRARRFLNAIVDVKMPPFTLMNDDGSLGVGPSDPRPYADNETKIADQLVHVLDTLQPAKFHWQWVELRLLLNEQVLIERIETQNMSLVEAVRSLSPNAGHFTLSENEKTFVEIVLTRLLVRPDAAPLYSEVVSLLGKSLEELLFLNAKWFLRGNDVLLGRKSIRQRLVDVAQRTGVSTKSQFWKPWGWPSSVAEVPSSKSVKRKLEVSSLEEGEVVEDGLDFKRPSKTSFQLLDAHCFFSSQQVTERALAELIFPCIDRSSGESCSILATELVKQLSTIEQCVSALSRTGNKQSGSIPSVEGLSSKGSSRKGSKGGSLGMGRRATPATDTSPPSALAIRASMWLRLHFLLRLLPIVYADRSMRHTLASVVLRLLGSRLVYEDAVMPLHTPLHTIQRALKKDEDPPSASFASSLDLSGDTLFDRFLSLFHGLIGSFKPSWLKPKVTSKSTVKSPRDFSAFDRELLESLQADLDRMELPATIWRRIQSAMPVLPSSLPFSISCHPPTLSSQALASLHPTTLSALGFSQEKSSVTSTRSPTNNSGKNKTLPSQDTETGIDPWTLLEDGTSCASSSSSVGGVSDHSNLKACSWLKGAVRVRRTDLTYIGATDDDS